MRTTSREHKNENFKVTPYVVDLAADTPEKEYEIIFDKVKPSKVEIQYKHADVGTLTGYLRFYQKMEPGDDYVEITNADALPEPIPVPIDSAGGSGTIYFWDFCGYALKIKFDSAAVIGTFKLSAGTRSSY